MDNRREAAELRIHLYSRHSLGDAAASSWHAIIAGTGAVLASILDALHESRRRQSLREIARHRHLIDAINTRPDIWVRERQ